MVCERRSVSLRKTVGWSAKDGWLLCERRSVGCNIDGWLVVIQYGRSVVILLYVYALLMRSCQESMEIFGNLVKNTLERVVPRSHEKSRESACEHVGTVLSILLAL